MVVYLENLALIAWQFGNCLAIWQSKGNFIQRNFYVIYTIGSLAIAWQLGNYSSEMHLGGKLEIIWQVGIFGYIQIIIGR